LNPRKGARSLISLGGALYAAMLAVALLWAWLRGLWSGWWTLEGLPSVGVAAALGVALGLGGVALSWAMDRYVPGVRRLGERFSEILAGATTTDALILAALSSIGEEALFRGCLQEEWGLWPATIAFALVHSGPERTYLWWTASAFVFGLGLALLYEYQGGLLAPVLMHFTINAINIRQLGRKGAAARELRRGPPASLADDGDLL